MSSETAPDLCQTKVEDLANVEDLADLASIGAAANRLAAVTPEGHNPPDPDRRISLGPGRVIIEAIEIRDVSYRTT